MEQEYNEEKISRVPLRRECVDKYLFSCANVKMSQVAAENTYY